MPHGWNVMRDLEMLQERMNRLFEDAAERRGEGDDREEAEIERADWYPAADVYERDGEYVVALDLPGVDRGALDVSLDENRLTIRGERPSEAESNPRRSERICGRFVRSFSLPTTVDRAAITADYKDGVLRLRLPKRGERAARPVEIEVS